jgi:hypothetical protein
VRVKFRPDADHPNKRVYGMINTGQGVGSKDGAPMELFAPAKGALGLITWLREHLTSIALAGGVALLLQPRGCRTHTHISLAESLRDTSCLTSTDLRKVAESLMSLPPLEWSHATRDSGTSRPKRTLFPRLALSDLARMLGESPSYLSRHQPKKPGDLHLPR